MLSLVLGLGVGYEDLLLSYPRSRRYGGGPALLKDPAVLERACVLLLAGWIPQYVSDEIGYAYLPAFHVAFKRATGEAPGAWQEKRGVRVRRCGRRGPILLPRMTWRKCDRKPRKRKHCRPRVQEPQPDFI